MKKIEVKKEVVVSTKFVADDGTEFAHEDCCRQYEEAMARGSRTDELKKKLKLVKSFGALEIIALDGYDDAIIDVYNLETLDDVENLKDYLNAKYGDEHGTCTDLSKLTVGTQIMVFKEDDDDWYWIFGNGTIGDLLRMMLEQYNYTMSKS